ALGFTDAAVGSLTAGGWGFFDRAASWATGAGPAPAATTTVTSAFDAFDRLVADGTATYAHDSLDRRTARSGTAFTYAGTEREPTGDGAQRFSRGPGGQLLALGRGATTRAVRTDLVHGDLVGLFDPAGAALSDARAYGPWGTVLGATGTTGPALGYQAQWTDPTTAKVAMGARSYDPAMATFASRDDWDLAALPSAGLNRFAYANADPLSYSDPTGQFSTGTFAPPPVLRLPTLLPAAARVAGQVAVRSVAAAVLAAVGPYAVAVIGLAAVFWIADAVLNPGQLARGDYGDAPSTARAAAPATEPAPSASPSAASAGARVGSANVSARTGCERGCRPRPPRPTCTSGGCGPAPRVEKKVDTVVPEAWLQPVGHVLGPMMDAAGRGSRFETTGELTEVRRAATFGSADLPLDRPPQGARPDRTTGAPTIPSGLLGDDDPEPQPEPQPAADGAGGRGGGDECRPLGGPRRVPAPQTTPDDCQRHAGRIQVQGDDLRGADSSWAWSRTSPPTAGEALAELARLRTGLSRRQLDARTEAFAQAEDLIRRCQSSGGCGPMRRTFHNRSLPARLDTARVDIEILSGLAFV
ncbi:MAG: RHS repeat-associated core domain-containing protein, partial [Acidimicrobiales bacterium]